MGKEKKSTKTEEINAVGDKTPEKNNKDAASVGTPNQSETQKKRNYRKRKSSDSRPCLSDGEIEESDEEINRVNLDDIRKAKQHKQEENIDADSDFSIDESSDEESNKKTEDIKSTEAEEEKLNLPENKSIKSSLDPKVTHEPKEKKEKEEPKEKVDIWKKRTVGPVFEEALRRYYERKAARGC